MTDQLDRLNKHEANPFRPDVPEDFRGISPHLYDFLRETAETLREQHNLTQAGDSTFSWEILTQVDMERRYNVGALGRFYHPTFGIITARYCRVGKMKDTEWLGAPVGLTDTTDSLKWTITNDMSLSNPDLVIGVGGFYVLPPEGSFAWVIVNGANVQALALRKRTSVKTFDKFIWGATERATESASGDGKVFGTILGEGGITEIQNTDTGGDFFLATQEDRKGVEEFQRFQPLFWTCNFPSTMIASLTTDGETLICTATFYKSNDLCGIIWESEDRWDHPLTKYDTNVDYTNCVVEFVIEISGDTVDLENDNGPVLTIEGKDQFSNPKIWYVRLNNYKVSGSATAAQIRLDFNDLYGGFEMDDRVYPTQLDRMFIGFVPASYSLGAPTVLSAPEKAEIRLSNIHATGLNATLTAGTGWPAHELRMTNGYDDTYNLTPERLVRNCYNLGYRKWFNHYVGMSHYFYWEWDAGEGRFIAQDLENPLNESCKLWHADLARRLKAHNYTFIYSVSYEMLNSFIPADWRQLDSEGLPALTGWEPPSSLFSPCINTGMNYLNRVFVAFADIVAEAEMPIHTQVGEPWWWIDFRDFKPYFYDPTTVAKWESDTGLTAPIMTTMVGEKTDAEIQYLNWLGDRLAESTAEKVNAVRLKYPDMISYVLIYLPQVLSGFAGTPDTPEAKRVNIPLGWAKPAFDVLQLEDYDFVINNEPELSEAGRQLAEQRLGYPREEQQYFSGFVLFKEDEQIWEYSSNAIRKGWEYGVPEVFIWAYTQVMRDGYVNLLDPANLFRQWNVPPGMAFVEHQADSEKRIRNWIKEATESAVDQVVALQAAVNRLQGASGVGGLTVRITAAEKGIQANATLISRESERRTQALSGFDLRLQKLESLGQILSEDGLVKIRVDLNALRNDLDQYVLFNDKQVEIVKTQLDGVMTTIGTLPGQFTAVYNRLNGIDDRITNLKFWQLADVPFPVDKTNPYDGLGLNVARVAIDGAGLEWFKPLLMPEGGTAGQIVVKVSGDDGDYAWTNLTAGIISFTPTGGISATTVQAAIAELEAEKVRGPGASTDNAIARWDGTAGIQIQNSGATIDDSGNITAPSVSVTDGAYGGGWNGSSEVPTKNAIYDKIESMTLVTTFLGLTDTPSSYSGHGLEYVRVGAGGGLEFAPVRQLPTGGASQSILQKYGAGDGEAAWSALTGGIVDTSANGYATLQDALTYILNQLNTQLGYIYGHGDNINSIFTTLSNHESRIAALESA